MGPRAEKEGKCDHLPKGERFMEDKEEKRDLEGGVCEVGLGVDS